MLPTEPIRPLKDVWLRPRRVFREMATRPVGIVDYLLAAAQGIGNLLALYRIEAPATHRSVGEFLGNSFAYAAIVSIASLFLMAFIYRRLGARAGGKSTTPQVVHVLAYGSLPMAASLLVWLLPALLIGEPALIDAPHAQPDGFLILLMNLQIIAYVLLSIWSVVLQVMGLSEIQGIATRKAFGLWVLGQIIGYLVCVFLALGVDTLLPGLLPQFIPQH